MGQNHDKADGSPKSASPAKIAASTTKLASESVIIENYARYPVPVRSSSGLKHYYSG